MVYLAETFPHSSPLANILYTVSSVGNPRKPELVASAKKKNLKLIVNQNGVAYPAWHGSGWEAANRKQKAVLDLADFIIYQSEFCRRSAQEFLSPPEIPFEVVYNPVDTQHFCPAATRPNGPLTLLLGGNQYERYRLVLALQTLKTLLSDYPAARLIVTGRLWQPEEEAQRWTADLLQSLNLTEQVIFTGPYTQAQAPQIYRQAHLLLHTKYNDPSPTLVPEALACGLPVVYLDCGGVPELVGEAGIGVAVVQSWQKIHLPEPEELAAAVLQVMAHHTEFSDQARARAVAHFDLPKFIQKHQTIFETVLTS